MRMGLDGASAALDAEGDRRLARKVERFRARADAAGVEQALYEGLLEALGYGGNGPPMLALARLLPWERLHDGCTAGGAGAGRRGEIEALLLGAAGLLPSQRGHRGPVDGYVEELERRFTLTALAALPSRLWKLWGVRPENAAPRRVAAAAALLAELDSPSSLLRAVEANTVKEAIAPLLTRASGYWLSHHDLCAAPCRLPPAFVGRSRALEITVNVIIPAAIASGDASLGDRSRRLYARLPRPAVYGVTRFIENALASEGMRVPVNARRAQGLLELHNNWCTKNGCGRCGLSRS
jgi:hypothetical protein